MKYDFGIRFDIGGKIIYEPKEKVCDTDMTMNCPGNVVQDIIRKDLSWDEISSGYWSTFSRNPDVYNVALWQLLHAPWKARKNYPLITESDLDTKNTSIADIIEKYGNPALSIFEKFGLYCAGCEAGMGEKITDGCRFHGLSTQQTQDLIQEINQVIKNKNSN